MKNNLKLTILTPEKELYSGEIVSLTTESDEGRFGILANHVAMISSVKPTVTKFIEINGKELKAFTGAGVLRVYKNGVDILCSACEWPEDVDVARAIKAKERAEERLTRKDGVDVERAENAVLRSLMRMKIKE